MFWLIHEQFAFSLCHYSLLKDASKIKIQVDEDEIHWRHEKEDDELEWSKIVFI